MARLADARRAKRRLAAELAGLPGVGPIGLAARGRGGGEDADERPVDYVVKVGVTRAAARDLVPADVDGVPVVTELVGRIGPQT